MSLGVCVLSPKCKGAILVLLNRGARGRGNDGQNGSGEKPYLRQSVASWTQIVVNNGKLRDEVER